MVPYLGCGCGGGPSARSLPAAAATCLVFGPLVAGARLAAAIAVTRLLPGSSCVDERYTMLAQLGGLVPLALAGAFAGWFAPAVLGAHAPAVAAILAGAAAAFFVSPCGIGSIALASSLRTAMPAAAAAFLCVAGIVDLRTWVRSTHSHDAHDALAYAMTAVACALVAARNGAALVHPKFAVALWACAIACALFAWKHRRTQHARLRIAPLIMLAGAILAAPPPEYHATETTLSDAFAGERLDFTGIATQTGGTTTLVRYAITCCRADAEPIVVALARRVDGRGWMHARGVLVQTANGLQMRADYVQAAAPPADPFVYR